MYAAKKAAAMTYPQTGGGGYDQQGYDVGGMGYDPHQDFSP